MPTRLHPFDLALIAVYLIGITLFGLRFRKSGKDKSLKNYFLASNTIPWWAIALSIVSAETSTLTIISIPGVAFAGDLGFLQVVLGYMLGRIVVAALFLPKYFQGEMLTAYQLIDQRFGPTLHKVTAGLFLLTRAAAEGVRVFAVSIVVGIAIGTNDTLSIAIISALTLLYTFEGGMAAVIWTDVVQMAIYIGGTIVAIATLGTHVQGGWTDPNIGIFAYTSHLGKLHIFNFAFNLTQSYTFWAGILGGTFLTMASHGTDQLMVQRMLAARNLRESRLALLSSGVVIFFQFTLFLLIGAGLYVFYLRPSAETLGRVHENYLWLQSVSPDRIFPTFIVTQMPIGIAGLLVAAILAAAMSNLSAALNSLSSTTVVDFYMHWRPQADDKERMMISRSSTVLWAIVLFAIAVYSVHAGGKGHVVETGLSIASVAYGCLLGVFLLGTLTRYATQTGSIIGMLCGFILNVYLWQGTFPITLGPITIPHIAFTWFVLIGAIATFAIGSLASLIFRKQSTTKVMAATFGFLLIFTTSGFSQNLYLSETNHRATTNQASVLATVSEENHRAQHDSEGAWGFSPTNTVSIVEGLQPRALSSASQTPKSTYDFTPISTLINEAIAAKKLPGAVVVIGHNNQVVFHQAYGNRKLAGEPGLDGKPSAAEPMTEDTIFDMASLTKCLATASAIMQLYEAGKLQFDDPVVKYLPEFTANGKEKVTIRELLTHYSGLPEDISLKDPWGLAAPDKAEGIRRAMNATLYGPPGLTFKYSDINFITLGVIVEKLSGQTEDEYVAEHIFKPLGMTHTRYLPFAKVCDLDKKIGAAVVYDSEAPQANACPPGTWTGALIKNIAPTTHDDEGKAAPETNPHYDMVTRGTVHDPTTRRMGGVAGHAGVFSTAHDVSLYAQALLDKLVHNTGPFPLKQSTLQLMTKPEQSATAVATATIFTPDGKPTTGVATRGFGWDINSAFSRPRGSIFPIGSFGHTGFTGTTLWIDPTSDTYVVLLSNAIHPRGAPPISPLRGEVATASAKALGLSSQSKDAVILSGAKNPSISPGTAQPFPSAVPSTQTGIDVLQTTHYTALATLAAHHNNTLKLGLLTNQSGIDAQGHRTVDILYTEAPKAVPGLALTTLFSPEHGISGTHDDTKISNDIDAATHLPVISLYGAKPADRHPTHDSLKDLDAVVIDLQDAGVRFWTYEAAMGYFLEAAATERDQYHHPLEIVILDRPNLVGGEKVQGPVSDPNLASYTDYMPLPVRHGLTFGELARYINGEHRMPSPTSPNVFAPLGVPLTVIRMENWTRNKYFDETHLPWINPSPNLKSPAAAVLYPAIGLIETTNISVGRGTDNPFQHIGACWTPTKPSPKKSAPTPCAPDSDAQLDGPALSAYLTARNIPGVSFAPTTFAVTEDANHYPGHGQTLNGIDITATDRNLLDTPELGIEILSALHHLYPTRFNLARAATLVASVNTMQSLTNNEDPRTIATAWATELNDFKKRRTPYLLYPQ